MPKITPFLWFDDKAEEAMNFKAATVTRSLLFAEEQVKGTTGADGVEQGLEFRGRRPGGPGVPAPLEEVPRSQPPPDLPHRHWPGHGAHSPGVAGPRFGADFPPALPRRTRWGPWRWTRPPPPGEAPSAPPARCGTRPTSKR